MAGFNYPLLLEPIAVPKPWAGGKLSRIPGREANGDKGQVGESWDVSTWPTAPDNSELSTVTIIRNGPLAGTPLDRVATVPVVVKVIDSGDKLSVQNHPDLPNAHKSEMWYILEADPEAYLYTGLAEGITAEKFCELLQEEPADENKILGALACYRNIRRGANFTIPAPTVHALGPGLVTFEISERSQVTYRLYDYNRPRSKGKLDIVPGCEALTADKKNPPALQPDIKIEGATKIEQITAYPTFCVFKVSGEKITIKSSSHQHLLTACKGDIKISGPTADWNIELDYSFTCLVPATEQPYTIDAPGSGEVLISPLQE